MYLHQDKYINVIELFRGIESAVQHFICSVSNRFCTYSPIDGDGVKIPESQISLSSELQQNEGWGADAEYNGWAN